MTTTRTRSRGHTGSRASAARAGAERKPVIIASVAGAVILLAFAALATSIGHIVLAATDHFMLKYSGVFALVLLTGSAVIGVLATRPDHPEPGASCHRAGRAPCLRVRDTGVPHRAHRAGDNGAAPGGIQDPSCASCSMRSFRSFRNIARFTWPREQ